MAQPDWEESWQKYDQPLEAWPGPPGYAPEHHEYTPPEYRAHPSAPQRPKPLAPEPAAPEPAPSEPVWYEPEPLRPDPSWYEPAYDEAPYPEPIYPEPLYPEPTYPEPAFPRGPYQPLPDPEPYSPHPRYPWERDKAEYQPAQSRADRRIRRWLLVAPGALAAAMVAALVVGHGGGSPTRITPASHSQQDSQVAGTPAPTGTRRWRARSSGCGPTTAARSCSTPSPRRSA